MKSYFLRYVAAFATTALLAFASSATHPAHADCASPSAEEGVMMYNTSYKTMQFCDGNNWWTMKGGSAAGLPIDCNLGEMAQWNGTLWACASGGATSTDTSLLSLQLASTRLTVSNGWTDPLTAESDVETVQNVNATYNSSGGGFYAPVAPGTVLIPQGNGTLYGYSNYVRPEAAFDGNTSQNTGTGYVAPWWSGVYGASIGKDWGAGITHRVTRFRIFGLTDVDPYSLATVRLQGSNDGTNWTTLYNNSSHNLGAGYTLDMTSGFDTSTAYRYHTVYVGTPYVPDGQALHGFSEVQFYEDQPPLDMAVISKNVLTATSVPSTGRLNVQVKDISGAAVANTDFKGYISRDNGTTWSQGTLAVVQTLSDGSEVYGFDNLSLTSQPSGTALRWKFTTHNNKEIQLHGAVLQWQ